MDLPAHTLTHRKTGFRHHHHHQPPSPLPRANRLRPVRANRRTPSPKFFAPQTCLILPEKVGPQPEPIVSACRKSDRRCAMFAIHFCPCTGIGRHIVAKPPPPLSPYGVCPASIFTVCYQATSFCKQRNRLFRTRLFHRNVPGPSETIFLYLGIFDVLISPGWNRDSKTSQMQPARRQNVAPRSSATCNAAAVLPTRPGLLSACWGA